MKRGAHTIESDKPAGGGSGHTAGGDASNSVGCLFTIVLLAALIVGAYLLGSANSIDRPEAPKSRIAVITPDGSSGPALAVVLAADAYELTYVTLGPGEDVAGLVRTGENSFLADFQTGVTKGSLYVATVIVLRGNMKLRVGDIAENDKLFAEVETYGKGGKNMSAYFNYAQSPNGPPRAVSPAMRKRIIVVGSLTGIDIGSSYDAASRTVRVLDLAPSEEAVDRYEARMDHFNGKMTELNAKRARVIRKGRR